MENLENKRFGLSIWVSKYKFGGGNEILLYKNKGFNFYQFKKWLWYFDYLAATFKILSPRKHVRIETFNYIELPEIDVLIKKSNNKVKSLISSVTKITNALQKHTDYGVDMFPEYNPKFIKAKEKLERKKNELITAKKLRNDLLRKSKILKNKSKS